MGLGDYIEEILPKNIFFITSQELEDMYPDCPPKEREYKITKLKGAVFIMQIGDKLKSGIPHTAVLRTTTTGP